MSSPITILYIDDSCKITDVCMLIKKYYFPFPTSKTILFDQIQKITLETAIHANQKWGPNRYELNTWFPLDQNRKSKNQYLAIHLKNKKIIPSFTPLQPSKVYNILKTHFETHGLDSVIFQEHLNQQNHFQDVQEQKQVEFQQQSSTLKNPLMDSTNSNMTKNI